MRRLDCLNVLINDTVKNVSNKFNRFQQVDEEASEEDTESDEMETRMDKLNDRLDLHDNSLSRLKKGNYLLKSRVDMAQEELRKERSRYSALEIELNNCLAELG